MLVLSFLLHAACVFIFQATFPRSKEVASAPATVYALLPGSLEAARIAPMLAASDPALFSSTKIFGHDVWKLPETAYVSSFDEETPTARASASSAPSQFLPPASGTAPVAVDGAPFRSRRRPGSHLFPPRCGSAAHWSGGRGLLRRTLTLPRWPSCHGRDLPRRSFSIAVSPDGLPMHLFPQRSSGNENLDRAALQYLAGGRFAAAPSEREARLGNGHIRLGRRHKAGQPAMIRVNLDGTGLSIFAGFSCRNFEPFG